jgi:hypothetical protein
VLPYLSALRLLGLDSNPKSANNNQIIRHDLA